MNSKQDLAPYLYHQGTNYQAYTYMGAHRTEDGYVFRVWAPHAERVFVVGDFNGWREDDPMERITEGGIFEAVLSHDRVHEQDLYKFKLICDGREIYKADL